MLPWDHGTQALKEVSHQVKIQLSWDGYAIRKPKLAAWRNWNAWLVPSCSSHLSWSTRHGSVRPAQLSLQMTLTLGAIWLQLHGDPKWEPSSWTSIDNAATKDSSRFKHFFSHKYYIRVYLKVFGLPPPRHTHTPIRHVSLPLTSLVLFCSLSYTPTSTPLEVRKAGSSSSWVRCNFSHVTKFSEAQVLLWKMMVRIWFLNFV